MSRLAHVRRDAKGSYPGRREDSSQAIDDWGLVIARSPKEPLPKLIFVTPSHQFPLGVTMSYQRRTALLDFARARNAFVFEDDYDAEFRFTGPRLPSLQGIDNSGR